MSNNQLRFWVLVACVVIWLVVGGYAADYFVQMQALQNHAIDKVAGTTEFGQIATQSVWWVWLVVRGACSVFLMVFYVPFFILIGRRNQPLQEKPKRRG